MSDFNQILAAVKNLTQATTTNIYVPSAGKEFSFHGLTAKQQKDLVKSAAEKQYNAIMFLNTVNDIISTSCTTPHDFLVSDRNYVIAVLRALTMGGAYKVKWVDVDLTELAKNNVPLPEKLRKATITNQSLVIECRIPTLKIDTNYNNSLLKTATNANKTLTDMLGDLFIYETMKYITSLKNEEANIDLSFSELSIEQQYQLTENLPAATFNKVIDYINTVKKLDDDLFKINDEVLDIDIDQAFFTL